MDAIAQSVELLTALYRDLEQQTAARFAVTLGFINRLARVAKPTSSASTTWTASSKRGVDGIYAKSVPAFVSQMAPFESKILVADGFPGAIGAPAHGRR